MIRELPSSTKLLQLPGTAILAYARRASLRELESHPLILNSQLCQTALNWVDSVISRTATDCSPVDIVDLLQRIFTYFRELNCIEDKSAAFGVSGTLWIAFQLKAVGNNRAKRRAAEAAADMVRNRATSSEAFNNAMRDYRVLMKHFERFEANDILGPAIDMSDHGPLGLLWNN